MAGEGEGEEVGFCFGTVGVGPGWLVGYSWRRGRIGIGRGSGCVAICGG